jgi:hypothetical protein
LELRQYALQAELVRFKITWEAARIKLPTKRELQKKNSQMTKLVSQPMTEVSLLAVIPSCPMLIQPFRAILPPCFSGKDNYKATAASHRQPTGQR